jgi:hypothetical protein
MNINILSPNFLVIGLVMVTLACQTVTDLVAGTEALTPTPVVLPAAAFDPPRSETQGFVNQPFVVESQYYSSAQITGFEILVNEQSLELKQTGAQTASIPSDIFGTSELIFSANHPGLFLVGKVTPVEPATAKTMALTWIASTPGSYSLIIRARDAAGNQNETSHLVEIVTP